MNPRYVERKIARLTREITENAEHNHISDYSISLDENKVKIVNRKSAKPLPCPTKPSFITDEESNNDARIVAPGYDVYAQG
jgi:hypothetical protein